MTRHIPKLGFAAIAVSALMVFVGQAAAEKACVRNDTSQTLYLILSSAAGKYERSLRYGDTICQKLPLGKQAKANILPFGGGRFGCREEVKSGKTLVVDRFGTMNKCAFHTE